MFVLRFFHGDEQRRLAPDEEQSQHRGKDQKNGKEKRSPETPALNHSRMCDSRTQAGTSPFLYARHPGQEGCQVSEAVSLAFYRFDGKLLHSPEPVHSPL
jgi:hypothetical protein